MMGKHGGECGAVGHVASAAGKCPARFLLRIQCRMPGHRMVPVTFREINPTPYVRQTYPEFDF